MEPNVKKEIDTLKRMIRNWYDFYLGCADGHKYDQIHVEEFDEVVSTHISPYLQRLRACNYITRREMNNFFLWVGIKHSDLSFEIAAARPKEFEDPIVILLRNLNLTKDQKKAAFEYLGNRTEKGK